MYLSNFTRGHLREKKTVQDYPRFPKICKFAQCLRRAAREFGKKGKEPKPLSKIVARL
jgi:hypothetical protein